ncbi:hypothetical protein KCP70_14530 [Salmonella enterica subsp. enterica]|nr:hypothetical protein KCP70_14530 [Salmonella enterica subsp. enterica]
MPPQQATHPPALTLRSASSLIRLTGIVFYRSLSTRLTPVNGNGDKTSGKGCAFMSYFPPSKWKRGKWDAICATEKRRVLMNNYRRKRGDLSQHKRGKWRNNNVVV